MKRISRQFSSNSSLKIRTGDSNDNDDYLTTPSIQVYLFTYLFWYVQKNNWPIQNQDNLIVGYKFFYGPYYPSQILYSLILKKRGAYILEHNKHISPSQKYAPL